MIYTNSDGGSRGNPGPGAIGVIVRKEGNILTKYSGFVGERVTNNETEYLGLIKALELALKFTKNVMCFLDSELIVNQLLGKYKVRNERLMKLFLRVQKVQDKFSKVVYKHVSRWDMFQILTDELLNEELDNKGYRKYRFIKK